jgi:hypothetical protein
VCKVILKNILCGVQDNGCIKLENNSSWTCLNENLLIDVAYDPRQMSLDSPIKVKKRQPRNATILRFIELQIRLARLLQKSKLIYDLGRELIGLNIHTFLHHTPCLCTLQTFPFSQNTVIYPLECAN